MKINTRQFQTKNFKGVLSLFVGNSLSKLILTLGGFVLANYYGPESYAVYNVFLSYMLIIPVLSTFRLENIMIMQKGSVDVRNLFSGIIWVSSVATLVIISLLGIFDKFDFVNTDLNFWVLFLCGLGALMTAWNNTQNALFTKFKLFRSMSVAFVLASFFSVLFQVFFYLFGLKENGLIYGWLVGLLASFIYNAIISKGRLTKVDMSIFKKSVRRHFEIIKFTYPSDSINALANSILPILAIAYFEKADVGVFSMAYKILTMPLVLLSSSISRVYFQKSVTLYNHDYKQLISLTSKVILVNVFMMLVFVLGMNTLGIYLLDFFLKDDWANLSEFILILSFWIVARSTLNPIISILMVIKKNHYSLIFNIYLLLVNFVAIYFGYVSDFINFLWTFSILAGIGYLILTIILLINLYKIKHDKINEE